MLRITMLDSGCVGMFIYIGIFIHEVHMEPEALRKIANRIRQRDLRAVFEAGAGHIGGEMSVIDLLTALYFDVMSVDPANPSDPGRDRLVLSKGHTALALYIALSVLNNFEMALPAALYSIVMYITATLFGIVILRRKAA